MAEYPSSDPFFPEPPAVQAPEEHEAPTPKPQAKSDWVVVDRVAGEGARTRLESERRRLENEEIEARIEHDDEHRLVLEVHADDEHEAIGLIGARNAQGVGRMAHRNREQVIEDEERESASGIWGLPAVWWISGGLAILVVIWLLIVFR